MLLTAKVFTSRLSSHLNKHFWFKVNFELSLHLMSGTCLAASFPGQPE